MSTTFDEAKVNYQTRKNKNIDEIENETFYSFCDAIDAFAYRTLYPIDPEVFTSTDTIATGVTSSALPSDFENIKPDECGIIELDGDGNDTRNFLRYTGRGSSQGGFWLDSANIQFTPNTVNTTVSHKLVYIVKYVNKTLGTDTFTVPDQYQDYINNAIDEFYDRYSENFAEFELDIQIFEDRLKELLKTYGRYEKGVTNNMTSF